MAKLQCGDCNTARQALMRSRSLRTISISCLGSDSHSTTRTVMGSCAGDQVARYLLGGFPCIISLVVAPVVIHRRVRTAIPAESDVALEKASRAATNHPVRFLAKRGNKFRVVPEQEALFFNSDGGLTKLCTREHEYWMQPSLSDLEKRLDEAVFFRVSRAAIVNLKAVEEVLPLVGGYGEIVLKNGARVEVSRRRMKDLLDTLQGN